MCDAVHTRERAGSTPPPIRQKLDTKKKGRKKRPGCTIDREREGGFTHSTYATFLFSLRVCVWSKQEEDNDRVSRYLKVFSCVIAAAAASCVVCSHARIDAPW